MDIHYPKTLSDTNALYMNQRVEEKEIILMTNTKTKMLHKSFLQPLNHAKVFFPFLLPFYAFLLSFLQKILF